MRTILVTLFLLMILGANAQTVTSPAGSLTDYLSNCRTEKVYVIHDKPYYAPGETIWGKVHLVDGLTHQAYAATPVVYLEWVKPNGEVSRSFQLQVKEGIATFDIATSAKDTTGNYTLRAYTLYQRNFSEAYWFQKKIRLLAIDEQADKAEAPDKDFTLRFFPEGGHMILGLENTVAFKAQDGAGKNIFISGDLLDEQGNKVGDVVTLHEGMGILRLPAQAKPGYSVMARFKDQTRTFALPTPLATGFQLKASTRDDENLQIDLVSNAKNQLAGATLVGHVRGQVFLEHQLGGGPGSTLNFPKKNIPSGLLHFTLFDGAQRPVAERLIFNKNPQEAVVAQPVIDQMKYDKREPVQLKVMPTLNDTLVEGHYAVSVFQSDLLGDDANSLDIRNYLWLQSDLRGHINNINQYFTQDDARTNTLLDLLLMTHGWRKFDWQEVLAGQLPDLLYPPEESITVAGKVTKFEQDKPVKADVQLTVMSKNDFSIVNVTTEEDGIFVFKGFNFLDTTELILQGNVYKEKNESKREKGKFKQQGSRYVDLKPLSIDPPLFQDSFAFSSEIYRPEALKEYAFTVRNDQVSASPDSFALSIDLAEVTVTSGRNRAELREQEIKNRYEEKGVFYFGGTPKFRADDPEFDGFRDRTIFDLLRAIIPSFRTMWEFGRQKVVYGSFAQPSEPVIVLDGRIIDTPYVARINPKEIAVVDLLEGNFSKLYGQDRLVVSLLSKKPSEIVRPNPGKLQLQHPGFYQARTFYSPDYALAPVEKPDYRTTLYWNPAGRAGNENKPLSFFTSDKIGRFTIRIEGITDDGIPFTGRTEFRVE